MDEWDGGERRTEYCPVHHIKCQEMKEQKDEMKKRIPIWVGKLFLTVLVLALGYMNLDGYRKNERLLTMINTHITQSSVLLNRLAHGINEVAVNQQTVMNKLDLDFKQLPHYDSSE